jgi:AcrR family transcriptional regulator
MSIRDERKQQSRQALLDAVLSLSSSGMSFSSMSLREITRHVGLVPTAFYRHFLDKNQLGLELIDQIALQHKRVLHELKLASLLQQPRNIEPRLDQFFTAVQQHPEWWIFISAERWGGNALLRYAIAREIEYLIEDLTDELSEVEPTYALNDLQVLSNLLINSSFNWAMSWINFMVATDNPQQLQQRQHFKAQTIQQIELLFRGIIYKK